MSEIDVLNLDELTSDVKTIVLKGIRHESVELTVQGYIDRVKKAKEIQSKDGSAEERTVTDQIDDAVGFIVEMFPSMASEDLRALSLNKLNKLIEFAMKAPEDIAKDVEAKATAGNV